MFTDGETLSTNSDQYETINFHENYFFPACALYSNHFLSLKMVSFVWWPAIFVLLVLSMVRPGIVFNRIACTSNRAVCTDALCNLTRVVEHTYQNRISLGCTTKKEFNNITIQLRTFSGKNRQAGQIDVNVDFCSFLSGLNNPILSILVPHLRETFEKNEIVCPIPVGPVKLANFLIDGEKFPILAEGPIEAQIVIKKGKYTPIYTAHLYGTRIAT